MEESNQNSTGDDIQNNSPNQGGNGFYSHIEQNPVGETSVDSGDTEPPTDTSSPLEANIGSQNEGQSMSENQSLPQSTPSSDLVNSSSITPSQATLQTTKKPKWLSFVLSGLIVAVASVLVELIIEKGLIYLGEKDPASEELGGILLLLFAFYISIGVYLLCSILFSWLANRQLHKRNIVDVGKKGFWFILLISFAWEVAISKGVLSPIYSYMHPQPGVYTPVSDWNKFDSAAFSFTYPKDTVLQQGNLVAGELNEIYVYQTADQYKKEHGEPLNDNQPSTVLLDISVVNPDYYKSDVVSGQTAAKTYADKVFAMNNTDVSPDAPGMTQGQVTERQIAGKTAYQVVVYNYFKNPAGTYQIRQENGYDLGTYSFYYVDYNNQVYQIRVSDVIEEAGPTILKTMVFK